MAGSASNRSNNSHAVSKNFMHDRNIVNKLIRMKTDGFDAAFDVLLSQGAPKVSERIIAAAEIFGDDTNVDIAPLVGFAAGL